MALLEPTLVRQALIDSITKLSPHIQWRNRLCLSSGLAAC
jgi:K+-transporting ATPase ATPase B chain